MQHPNHRWQIGSIPEQHTDDGFGRPCSLFSPCLIPIKILLILIGYHLVQVLDEIRHLCLRESLVTTLFVVCDPSLKFHLHWHKETVEPNTNSWRWSREGSAWSFSNGRQCPNPVNLNQSYHSGHGRLWPNRLWPALLADRVWPNRLWPALVF